MGILFAAAADPDQGRVAPVGREFRVVTEATEVVTRNEASRGPRGVSQVHRPVEGIQCRYLAKAPVAVH
jgi:hypothetical protein